MYSRHRLQPRSAICCACCSTPYARTDPELKRLALVLPRGVDGVEDDIGRVRALPANAELTVRVGQAAKSFPLEVLRRGERSQERQGGGGTTGEPRSTRHTGSEADGAPLYDGTTQATQSKQCWDPPPVTGQDRFRWVVLLYVWRQFRFPFPPQIIARFGCDTQEPVLAHPPYHHPTRLARLLWAQPTIHAVSAVCYLGAADRYMVSCGRRKSLIVVRVEARRGANASPRRFALARAGAHAGPVGRRRHEEGRKPSSKVHPLCKVSL